MKTFEQKESSVRSYVRSFPVIMSKATGSTIIDEEGECYIDFLSGAGTLNYGHNHEVIKKEVLKYIREDNIMHGLDMATEAKKEFIESFERVILEPRGLDYKLQFTGPTGTNAVEAALKLARLNTNRTNVVCFTNAFHGVTLGSVATTGNSYYREATGVSLQNTTFMPFDGYLGSDVDTIEVFRRYLEDSGSGLDHPAAVIVETVQGEGGVNVSSAKWLRKLEQLCREFEILFIIDDIQVGCGRTGRFFSFEEAGIEPDIILLSKSLGAYGLPFSLVLLKPELDIWKPGEHNGTFRGNNLAFIAAKTAIEHFWDDDEFQQQVIRKGRTIGKILSALGSEHSHCIKEIRGRGLIWALEFQDKETCELVARKCFEHNLIIETCGPDGNILKCLPALTISENMLEEGLSIIERAIIETTDNRCTQERQAVMI